jgi:TPR repeat protein
MRKRVILPLIAVALLSACASETNHPYGLFPAETFDRGQLFDVGLAYQFGNGVTQNFEQAATAYRRAFDEEHDTRALNNLGILAARGQGIPQSYATAASYFRQAADLGNASARTNLGLLYHFGLGVSQNYDTAARLYGEAAYQGNGEAQALLGGLINEGKIKGGMATSEEAKRLFQRAAEQGRLSAWVALSRSSHHSDLWQRLIYGDPRLDPAAQVSDLLILDNGCSDCKGKPALARKQTETADLKARAAALDAVAEYDLALLYRDGDGVPHDLAEHARLLHRAANHNYAPAHYALGIAYLNGIGVGRDLIAAHMWFNLAARQGHTDAPGAQRALDDLERVMTSEQVVAAQQAAAQWRPFQEPL